MVGVMIILIEKTCSVLYEAQSDRRQHWNKINACKFVKITNNSMKELWKLQHKQAGTEI